MVDTSDVNKYIRALENIIESPVLRLFSFRFVKKTKIDDIMCCIYSSIPEEIKNTKKNSIKSNSILKKINMCFKRCFFDNTLYSYHFSTLKSLIDEYKKTLKLDVSFVKQSGS